MLVPILISVGEIASTRVLQQSIPAYVLAHSFCTTMLPCALTFSLCKSQQAYPYNLPLHSTKHVRPGTI